ncbi:hypothetical protein Y1Q_0017758 [Alligator mississippiensis]|uniref:Uncharacterized protein n=1 Tax=Alligator mississippiensis TaxID=8496 RepID=A0A151MJL7_ALLMI|nr:hypothetical protein Y1Q_0017758 [Alligator mississippiensis]
MSQDRRVGWVHDEEGWNKDYTNTSFGNPSGIVSVLHHLGEGGVVEDPYVVDVAHPAREDVGEASSMVDNILEDDGKQVLALDELLDTLGQAEGEDVGAVHSPHTFGEAHMVEGGNYPLWVDKADEVVGQNFLNGQVHLLAR